MSCGRDEGDLLGWLDDPAAGAEHVAGCPACAAALTTMRRLRALARAARPARRPPRRAARALQTTLPVAAAVALVATVGVGPFLRRRIAVAPAASVTPGRLDATLFWTSPAGPALATRAGR